MAEKKPKRRRWLKATRIGLRIAKFFPLPIQPFVELAELAVDQAEKQLGPKTGTKKKEFTEGFLGDLYAVFGKYNIPVPLELEEAREIAEEAVGFKHDTGQFLREGEEIAEKVDDSVTYNVKLLELRGVTKFEVTDVVE